MSSHLVLSSYLVVFQMLYQSHPRHALVRLLGIWKPLTDNSAVLTPISGLAYYCTPPNSVYQALMGDPWHLIVHVVITFLGTWY